MAVNKAFVNNYSTGNTIFPCKGCKDRFVGCHAGCEKYLAAKRKHDKERYEDRVEKSYIINEGSFLGDSGHSRKWKKH